jgi:renalase
MNTLKLRPRVAVIGAGMAGLSCPTALREADYKISLFDKSRGRRGV